MKISGCIITKNEEGNIEQCIKSMLSATDELIVVDTGSTDNTVQIAQKYNAKVFNFKWINDFSAARNYAISKCKGDWIIFLDADEIISEEHIQIIRPKLKNMLILIDAVMVRMYDSTRDCKKIFSTYTNIRIFRNKKNLRYFGKIHESLKNEGGTLQVRDLSNLITVYHFGYDPNILNKKNKIIRNLKLLEQQLALEPNNGNLHFYICNTYSCTENWGKIIEHGLLALKYGIDLLGRDAMVYHLIIKAMVKRDGFTAEAVSLMKEGLNKFPDYGDLYLHQAIYFSKQELLIDEAVSWEKAIECYDKPNHAYPSHCTPEMLKEIYQRLAVIYNSLDDVFKCIIYMSKLLQVDKFNSLVFKSIIDKLLKNGEQIKEIIKFINNHYSKQNDLAFVVKCLLEINALKLFVYYYELLTDDFKKKYEFFYYYANQDFHKTLKSALSQFLQTGDYYYATIAIINTVYCNDSDALMEIKENSAELSVKHFCSYLLEEIATPEKTTIPLFIQLLEHSLDFGLSDVVSDLITLKDDYLNPPDGEMAVVFYERKMWDIALVFFQNAIQMNSNDTPYLYIQAARCFQKLNQFEKSTELLLKAADIFPKTFIIYYELVNLLIQREDISILKLTLRKALEVFPESQWLQEKAIMHGIN